MKSSLKAWQPCSSGTSLAHRAHGNLSRQRNELGERTSRGAARCQPRLWLTKVHQDGRRWIGMRAGAYLVDRATKAAGKSAADLVSASTTDVMDMGTAGLHSR